MKPGIPQGTRDFSPEIVRKRQYILKTLQGIFEKYGYQPLETPSMENLSTLMGKYGDEGDRLIFKILNNGISDPKNQEKAGKAFQNVLAGKNDVNLTERALRYDLTIPFARYVVMHQNDLALPFKRYQMQPVWRADRPQRGRYREFWQCDCDVVGSNSLLNEAELLCIYQEAFKALQVPDVTVKINSRKILAGIAEYCGAPEKLTDITVAIDKLDKIGVDKVLEELSQKGLDDTQKEKLNQLLFSDSSKAENIDALEQIFKDNNIETGYLGVQEIKNTLAYHDQIKDSSWDAGIKIDITLARGLNYYTGIIAEVVTGAVEMGSIGGGGRYDDLTGLFGLKGLSGVGISFGIDRIYDVLEELQAFPAQVQTGTKAFIINFGGAMEHYGLSILQHLRREGIAAEIYPEAARFDKQMKYANKRNFPYVLLPGESEMQDNKISIKNFTSGAQNTMSLADCIALLQHA